MKIAYLLGAALLVWGCGGTSAPAAHPVDASSGLGDAPPPASGTEALPQFFWIEVSGDDLVASGTHVDAATLRTLARQEASSGQVRGAALTLSGNTTEQQALVVVGLLLESGFRHVVLSSRVGLAAPTPTPAPAVASSAGVEPAHEVSVDTPSAPVSEPTSATPSEAPTEGPRIEVKQMGLHIGGGPNDPEHHAVYADPITRRFEDIRQCYALVPEGPKKASFGVDLLVPAKGGQAKIENYRTAIGGKEFHLCVLGVFGSIEFKAPGKATMVSYSVLFKPL